MAGGTGIGLSLVKGFTEAQSGSVSAENRPGGGALFTVARYLHAWGYTKHAMASFGRIVGIQSTLLALSYMVVASAYYILIA